MTKEKQIELILQLINSDAVPTVPKLNNRKETQKEMQIRVAKNFTEYKVKIAIKKNLQKQFNKSFLVQ